MLGRRATAVTVPAPVPVVVPLVLAAIGSAGLVIFTASSAHADGDRHPEFGHDSAGHPALLVSAAAAPTGQTEKQAPDHDASAEAGMPPGDAPPATEVDAADATRTPGGAPGAGATVGGEPATTARAAGLEAAAASTAPTPPNGAEPAAAGSSAAALNPGPDAGAGHAATTGGGDAVLSSPRVAGSALAYGSPTRSALPDLVSAGPLPDASGLSPDTTHPGAVVAILAFAVLLFVVAQQLVDRRDPGLAMARDAEGAERFR